MIVLGLWVSSILVASCDLPFRVCCECQITGSTLLRAGFVVLWGFVVYTFGVESLILFALFNFGFGLRDLCWFIVLLA